MSSFAPALCLGLVLTPIGCGGANQEGSFEPARMAAAKEGPWVSEGTYSTMMACVSEGRGRLTDTVYAMQFDVEVTISGDASRVELRDSSPKERALAACIQNVLEGMTFPASVLRLPKGKAVSAESHRVVGQVWEEVLLAGAATSLAPLYITAVGVTFIVMVGVYVVSSDSDAASDDDEADRERCHRLLVICLENKMQPSHNVKKYGKVKDCQGCFRECVNHHGEWPFERCPGFND